MVCGATLPQSAVRPHSAPLYTYRFNLLFLGDDGVGKTSLIKQLVYGRVEGVEGFERNVEKTFELGEVSLTLAISEEAYEVSSIGESYDLAVVVFDLSTRNTFPKTLRYTRIIKEMKPSPPLIIVGNKKDLFPRAVSYSEALKTAAELGADYVETSANTGEGVKKLRIKIFKRLISLKIERLKGMTQ